jgi:hypothetical protein
MLYHKALHVLHYGSAAIPYALCFTSLPVPPVPLQPPDCLAYGKLSQWVLILPRLSTLYMEKTILFPFFFFFSHQSRTLIVCPSAALLIKQILPFYICSGLYRGRM